MRTDATAHPEAAGDAPLDENVRGHGGLLRLPNLDRHEGDEK